MDEPGTPMLRFRPATWAALLNLALLGTAFVLFLGRKPGMFRSQPIIDAIPGFYTHVLNFSLSYLFLAGVGFLWLMMGVRMRHVAWAAFALAAANVACEAWLPLLNTRDPVDASYGVAGTLLAFAWLWLVQRFALLPANPDPS